MKRVRISKVGASRTPARMCSRSRSWPGRLGWRASGNATPTGAGMAEVKGLALSARTGSIGRLAMALPAGSRGRALGVRLLQLALGPLCRILGLHAFDGLGVHVHEDVLDERLGRLPARLARVSGPAAELGRFLEGNKLGIPLPQG